MGERSGHQHASGTAPHPHQRREATAHEAKTLAHPLRPRILRLCVHQELTNKQLADRLDRDPGTVLYHVRRLAEAGLVEQTEVRTGDTGALEKSYRSTRLSWWLSFPPADTGSDEALAPVEAVQDELREADPGSPQTFSRFTVHPSPEEVTEFERRIQALVDEDVATEEQRLDRPAHGGMLVPHRMAE